jgi:GTP-binding protein
MKRPPVVAVVGKPNAGKSTFFNRVVRRRRAITHATSGVTRDVVEELVFWNDVPFTLVDTGGYFFGARDAISRGVRDRVIATAKSAAVIVFLCDVDTGPTDEDEALLRELRSERARMILVVNKVENDADRWSVHEFHRLGIETTFAVSALHGEGVGEVLDEIAARLPRRAAPRADAPLAIAVVGKPNVGKSSLVNALVGEERNIVSEIPGTTRDSVSIVVRRAGREFVLIDTAGVKRRARTERGLAAITSHRSLSSARRADVVLVVIDASAPISRQDVRVASEGHRARAGIVILANKWDLVEKDSKTEAALIRTIREAMQFLYYAPVLTVSALTNLRVDRILPLAARIEKARETKVSTSRLNKAIETITTQTPPGYYAGGAGKIYYATQTGVKPPTFTLFVNKAAYFPRSYIRYINNQLRNMFTFEGTAVTISLKSKER